MLLLFLAALLTDTGDWQVAPQATGTLLDSAWFLRDRPFDEARTDVTFARPWVRVHEACPLQWTVALETSTWASVWMRRGASFCFGPTCVEFTTFGRVRVDDALLSPSVGSEWLRAEVYLSNETCNTATRLVWPPAGASHDVRTCSPVAFLPMLRLCEGDFAGATINDVAVLAHGGAREWWDVDCPTTVCLHSAEVPHTEEDSAHLPNVDAAHWVSAALPTLQTLLQSAWQPLYQLYGAGWAWVRTSSFNVGLFAPAHQTSVPVHIRANASEVEVAWDDGVRDFVHCTHDGDCASDTLRVNGPCLYPRANRHTRTHAATGYARTHNNVRAIAIADVRAYNRTDGRTIGHSNGIAHAAVNGRAIGHSNNVANAYPHAVANGHTNAVVNTDPHTVVNGRANTDPHADPHAVANGRATCHTCHTNDVANTNPHAVVDRRTNDASPSTASRHHCVVCGRPLEAAGPVGFIVGGFNVSVAIRVVGIPIGKGRAHGRRRRRRWRAVIFALASAVWGIQRMRNDHDDGHDDEQETRRELGDGGRGEAIKDEDARAVRHETHHVGDEHGADVRGARARGAHQAKCVRQQGEQRQRPFVEEEAHNAGHERGPVQEVE